MTAYDIVGAYRVVPTKESILQAARHHGHDWLIDESGEYTDEIHWKNHDDLVLVEVRITGGFSAAAPETISQGDQAPYMEFYLDPTGLRPIDEAEALQTDGRRLCFFLHFADPRKPLMVGPDALKLPVLSDLPERLRPWTHYLPVD